MIFVYIGLIVLQIGVIIFFVRRNLQVKKKVGEVFPSADSYNGLRNMAIGVTAADLKLNLQQEDLFAYGVLMDWDMGEAITTLAAYITGAASLCFSTGGMIVGGGKSPAVGEAAVDFVLSAQEYIGRAMPVTTTDLPAKDCIRFYFLTNKGIYAVQEQAKHFHDNSSPWILLFLKGNVVINEIRGQQVQ